MMSDGVFWWWCLLCSVATVNILAWSWTAAGLARRRAEPGDDALATRRLMLLLSAGYVFGCAYRSFLPVYDVPRLVLFDTWLSSVAVGRTVATVAELCFAGQWALVLREISRATGDGAARSVSRALVPLIAVAETWSWSAVLTTSNLGHVVEESIWALAAALVVAVLAGNARRCEASLRPLLALCCVAGAAYVAYMVLVDVPRYGARWLADEANARQYLGWAQGLADVAQRWTVSHRWEDWKGEVTWMSLYFSVAVWLSIALVHAPRPRAAAPGGLRLRGAVPG